MKNQPQNRISGAQSGFTMIELVVTVFVFGVLCAAAAVNWGSFMKYQNLRQEAVSFQKELMAMKAKALENGDTIRVNFNTDSTGYKVIIQGVNDTGGAKNDTIPRKFSSNVKFGSRGEGGWASRIKITPDNLNAFGAVEGSVEIKSAGSSKKIFRVVKYANSIKPELEYKSGGGSWKKM